MHTYTADVFVDDLAHCWTLQTIVTWQILQSFSPSRYGYDWEEHLTLEKRLKVFLGEYLTKNHFVLTRSEPNRRTTILRVVLLHRVRNSHVESFYIYARSNIYRPDKC